MSLARKIMNVSYETSQGFKADKNYEAGSEAALIESLVNQIHHGYYDVEWLPRFFEICKNHPSKNTEGFSKAYKAAVVLIEEEGHDIPQD